MSKGSVLTSAFGAIVGAVIGFYVGGPAGAFKGFMYGWTLGSFAGSLLFPPDQPTIEGPRLEDLKVQRSEYGAVIPKVFGKVRMAGNIMWSTDLQERRVKEEVSDVDYIRYYYDVSCAVLICEGEIDGIDQIRANSKLVYDKTTGERMKGLKFTVYKGTETQTADPLIAADVGAANCPAYRDRAYIVFEKFPLEDFGNSLPHFEFVVSRGYGYDYAANVSLSADTITRQHNGFIDEKTGLLWTITGNYTIEVIDPGSAIVVADIDVRDFDDFVDGGGIAPNYLLGLGRSYDEGTVYAVFYPAYDNSSGTVYMQFDPVTCALLETTNKATESGLNTYEHGAVFDPIVNKVYYFGGTTTSGYVRDITGGIHSDIITKGQDINRVGFCARWVDDSGRFSSRKVWSSTLKSMEQQGVDFPQGPVFYDNQAYFAICSEAGVYLYRYQKALAVSVSPSYSMTLGPQAAFLDDTTAGWGNGTGFCFPQVTYDPRRNVLYATEVTFDHTFIWYADLNTDEPSFVQITGFAHNCRSVFYDEQTDRLFIGTGAGGAFYAYTGPPDDLSLDISRTGVGSDTSIMLFSALNSGFMVTYDADKVFIEPVSDASGPLLSTVVSEILTDADLEASDIDVTDMTDRVKGYGIARQTSPRSALEPLRKAYRFDMPESDWKLKAVMRGAASSVTLNENYLGIGGDDKITITRRMETELPNEVAITYTDPGRDYLPATQRAKKTTRKAGNPNIVALDLPLTLSADEAVQLAEILLHQDWMSRTNYNISTTRRYLYLDPGDVITVPADGEEHTMLISSMVYNPDGKLDIEGVRDLTTAYSSESTASSGDYTNQVVSVVYPSVVQLLDIPRWYQDKNTPDPLGPELICTPLKDSGWEGTEIFKSADGDAPWSSQIAFEPGEGAIIGTTDVASLGNAVNWGVLDTTNSFLARPGIGRSLSSITWAQMLDYGNLCRVGDETLQFMTVTNNGDGTFTCSDLLRGRFGTEWAISGHSGVESFAMLNESLAKSFFHPPNSDFDPAQIYVKPVTRGETLTEVRAQSIVNRWRAYKPYAPTHVQMDGELFVPDSVSITPGSYASVTGDIPDAQELNDGSSYVVEETSAANFDPVFSFSGVDSGSNTVTVYGRYEGSGAHTVKIQVWDWNTSSWDDTGTTLATATSNAYHTATITPADHILNGEVQIRIYHETSGATGHFLYVDFVSVGPANFTLTWVRRDRKDHEWQDGGDIDMSEGSEAYEIYVYTTPLRYVVREGSATSESFTLTSEQMHIDISLIPNGGQFSDLAFAVFQVSEEVGRGYGAATGRNLAATDEWLDYFTLDSYESPLQIIEFDNDHYDVAADPVIEAWYDLSQSESLYQDVSKTTPVTAAGQAVACWADKSGNGNDLLASAVSDRPTYRASGFAGDSSPYLEFDGTEAMLAEDAFTVGVGETWEASEHTILLVAKDGGNTSFAGYAYVGGTQEIYANSHIATIKESEVPSSYFQSYSTNQDRMWLWGGGYHMFDELGGLLLKSPGRYPMVHLKNHFNDKPWPNTRLDIYWGQEATERDGVSTGSPHIITNGDIGLGGAWGDSVTGSPVWRSKLQVVEMIVIRGTILPQHAIGLAQGLRDKWNIDI